MENENQQPEESIPDSSQQSQDSTNQQSSQETIPQTQIQQAPATDRYTQLLEATLREQNQRLQTMQDQFFKQQQQPQETPPPQAQDPATFFNNPHGELEKFRKQINDDLQRTVAPLLDLAKGLRGEGTPYGNLRNQFLSDPRYSGLLSDPKVAFAVDKIMENQTATPDTMRMAIIQAAGLKQTGELDVALVQSGVDINRFQSQPTAQPPVATTPPHMRPTNAAPRTPPETNGNKLPLTELEKRLARERHMTDEQYREWIEVKPSDVITSKIGREK